MKKVLVRVRIRPIVTRQCDAPCSARDLRAIDARQFVDERGAFGEMCRGARERFACAAKFVFELRQDFVTQKKCR